MSVETDVNVNEFFEIWNEDNGDKCCMPHELARELIDIYKNSKTYFRVENKITMTHQEYIKELYRLADEHKEKEKHENNIKIVMRQTNYDRSTAEESLKRNQTVEKCIEEYLNVKPTEVVSKSMNQEIYSSIRNWMNNK